MPPTFSHTSMFVLTGAHTHLSCWRSCLRPLSRGSARVRRARARRGSVRDLRGCAHCGSGRGASGRGPVMSSFSRHGSGRD